MDEPGYDHTVVNMKNILDAVITALWTDEKRKFTFSDMPYLFHWWKSRDLTVKRMVYQLLRQGRLFFVGGGWSMSDEATTSYHAIIDHFTYNLRKINATFLECGRPLVSWQADVFGHSREFAALLAMMGFDGHFVSPISFEDELARMKSRSLEFVWRGSDDLGRKIRDPGTKGKEGTRNNERSFLECGRPLVSWQADVFGHSREFAALLAMMGFDGHFVSPISFEDELARMKSRSLEFVWRGSDDADVFLECGRPLVSWQADVFLECGRPLVSWQADVFASLLAMMGFDGHFVSPISFEDELARMKSRSLEFVWRVSDDLVLKGKGSQRPRRNNLISFEDELARMKDRTLGFVWRGSDDLGSSTDIYTHKLFDGYWSPPGFCFGGFCNDPLIVTSDSVFSNVEERGFVTGGIYNRGDAVKKRVQCTMLNWRGKINCADI
ncbi:hypothetical protein PYW07_012889 [Mythimna separata]|uniref:Glycoside hydrolase family 38 N-terminal domain-containing protein n=1 Tax=Mythimna separata TaxID=271217 RepID=A0AAD7Y988_MYTSE|nr:hypothetical protein PYW07_012889 [Mythimna separata]